MSLLQEGRFFFQLKVYLNDIYTYCLRILIILNAIARKEKNSERWFVGNSNGGLMRISEIDLSFLNESQTYLAKIYRDSDDSDYKTNPQSYTIETKEVTKQTTLQIKTVAAGGYAISLHPLNKKI